MLQRIFPVLRRNQTVTDSRKNSLPDQTLQVGSHLHIYPVHLPPTLDDASVGIFGKNSAFCVVTTLDHEDFKVAWCTTGIPSWILWTERWQWLTPVEADLGDGKGKRRVTKYDSMEVFGGFAAYFVKWFVGSKLNLGFQAQAEGLKIWAERNT
jgi:hypothetical protein